MTTRTRRSWSVFDATAGHEGNEDGTVFAHARQIPSGGWVHWIEINAGEESATAFFVNGEEFRKFAAEVARVAETGQ